MEKKFKTGDIVRLITGTQKMKVIEYYINTIETLQSNYRRIGNPMSMEFERIADNKPYETSQVVCEWYNRNNVRQSKRFEQDELELVK